MNRQGNLFKVNEYFSSKNDKLLNKIKGLNLIENYISEEEERNLIAQIDKQNWLNDLKRRVQHYGYKYDYKARRIDVSMKIGSLPNWGTKLADRFYQEGIFSKLPDQLIVNEYQIGQGIAPHIDCEPCFDDTIVSLSLNATTIMDFTNSITNEKIPIFLNRRSLVVLKGPSRYDWKHSIAARKTDKHDGSTYSRERRISLTFRKVLIS